MQVQNDFALQRILRICNLIQSNSEFMTVVKRSVTTQEQFEKNILKTLDEYLKEKTNKLNQENFIQIFIQIAYFAFSCRRYGLTPIIRTDDIRVQQTIFRAGDPPQKRFSVIVHYRNLQQKAMQPFQSIQMLRDIYTYLFKSYQSYLKLFESELSPPQLQFKKFLDKFQKDVNFLFKKENLNLFKPNKQKQFYLCLEQTKLFKQFAFLLKIKNWSMLDMLKMSQENFKKFKECKAEDVKLVSQYISQKKKNGDNESAKNKQKLIQTNIMDFFKFLSKNSNCLIEENPSSSKGEKENTYRVRFNYKIREKRYSNNGDDFYKSVKKIIPQLPQTIQEQLNNTIQNLPLEIEYNIEYSSDRNSICVRLFNNIININVESSDFLMYQSNILTFEAANVNIQLADIKPAENLPAKKVLAFKGASCFNNKQPPLQKILLLMDITMIAAKIYEPELNASRVMIGGLKDYQKLNMISNKINHYTKLYLKCAKKVYSQ